MKTIHPIPPAGSEEALIQALETLLDQENPDEARLQALLDQLDRQTGAAPLDPEAGWADLQRRRSTRPKRRGLRRFPLALAAVLVCLAVSGTALGNHWGLHDKFSAYFGITGETAPLIQEAGTLPDYAVTSNGATVTIRQTVADANTVYVLYELETPEDVSLRTEHTLQWRNGPSLDLTIDGTAIDHSTTGGQLEVIDDHHALFLVAIQSDRQAIAPGTLELEFQDLGYYAEDTEAPRFVPVLSGTWNLSWALTTVEEGRNLDLTEPIVWEGMTYPFDRLNLTPLSLSVSGSYGTGPVEELPWNFTYPPITLHFQDGSQQSLNSDPSSATTYLTGGAFNGTNYDVRIYVQFAEILDPAQVTAVQIGNQTFPLP